MDPDGEAKDADEARLLRLLKSRLNGRHQDVMDRLGWPPDLNKLDADFWASQEGLLISDLRPEIERMARAGLASASATVPILWDEVVVAREALEWASAYTFDLVRGLLDNDRGFLQRVIPEFIETPGMTVGDLKRELEPLFGETRAQRIAVTEVTRAYQAGQQIIQKELARGGIRRVRQWQTSGDRRVCEICKGLDQRTEEEWAAIYPGAAGGPPSHVNCRCWTTFVRAK